MPALGRSAALIRDLDRRVAAIEDSCETTRHIPNPIEWSQDVSGTFLDEWQCDFLLDAADDILMNCARQTGKTQIVSLKSAFRTKFLDRQVAVLAPTLRQSTISHRRAKLWLMRDETEFLRTTAHQIELMSGGTFSALPGDRPDLSIRGDTIDDLIVDEASRIKDALIVAATPATATRKATITYMSTPAGRKGAFWHAWDSEEWWAKITITAEMCPRIPEGFLGRERRRLGRMYDQEYLCQFLDTPGGLFISDDLEAIFGVQSEEEFKDLIEVPERDAIW